VIASTARVAENASARNETVRLSTAGMAETQDCRISAIVISPAVRRASFVFVLADK
jgi:hypothetical protein